MLKPVMSSRENGPAFVPDDLLVVKEPDAQQTVQDLARELRCMPDVRHLEMRNECEGIRPVGPRVAGYRSFVVTGGAFLHVAGLGRPAAIQSSAIAPFG